MRLFLLVLIPGLLCAQLWTGVIDPARAVDWSGAGLPGSTLPSASWTQCGSTIASGASAATINAALAGCASNHYVQLAAGTFAGGITWTNNSVGLRGMGANQTTISGSGTASCFGLAAMVAICSTDGTYANGPPGTIYNWTAGYSQGTTVLTLSSVTGIVAGQTMVMLDQCDDGYSGTSCGTGSSVDTGNYFVCSDQYAATPTGCGSEGGTNAYRPHRAQLQIVVPIAVNAGTKQITIPAPGLYSPTWRSGQSPQAWIVTPIHNTGIENLTIDSTTSGADGVLFWNAYQCWVSGLRFNFTGVNAGTGLAAVWIFQGSHNLIKDSYIYQPQSTDPYGIQFEIASDNLVQNNIFQQNRSPIVVNGPSSGDVFAYNFTILNLTGSNGNWSFWNHSSGIAFDLWEGNVAGGFANDDIHGSHNMITRFRNYFTGHEDSNTGQITPTFEAAYNRYSNLIGNVLGTSTFDTTYQQTPFTVSTAIYTLGAGNPGTTPAVPDDSLVSGTAMRWGNYDTVNAAVRFVSGEVPSGISPYSNAVPSSHTLPASFYLSSKPSWWPLAKAWPPIGPDVTGGNIANVGGFANTIPAQDCYLNTMGGPSDGSGSVLTFNATTCYGSRAATSPITYVAPNSGDVVYVPTWAQKATDGTYHAPSGKEILYLHLNTTTGYYELWSCEGTPGDAASSICNSGSQSCISCLSTFQNAVWPNGSGGTLGPKSVGRAQWSRDGTKVVFSAQDGASTLPGYGLPSGALTAVVDTSGTSVTWVSGSKFPALLANQPININGVIYTVMTVNGSTSLTLTTSAGTQTGVTAAASVFTADPGVGGDNHIWVMSWPFATTNDFWQLDSAVCVTKCAGTAQGFSTNGTRTVPINGTRGGWFPAFLSGGNVIVWSNVTCATGIDATCTTLPIVEGTEVEIATVSFASPINTSTVSAVSFTAPAGVGGISCTSTACTANSPQYGYEVENSHPNDPTTFYVASYDLIQTGDPLAVSLTAPGTVKVLGVVCPGPGFNDQTKCPWSEHIGPAFDGYHFGLASTQPATGQNGCATASPVCGTPQNYPPYQELAWVVAPTIPLASASVPVGGMPFSTLTGFNDSSSLEYVGSTCHVRFDSVAISPNGDLALLGMEETDSIGAKCTGGHGIYGYVFALAPLPQNPTTGGVVLVLP